MVRLLHNGELLNETLSRSLWHARRLIAQWQTDYNEEQPLTSLGGLTPNEFATRSTWTITRTDSVYDQGHQGARVSYGPSL